MGSGLIRTTEKKGHWHLLYSNGQQVFCSTDDEHNHEIMLDGTLSRVQRHTHDIQGEVEPKETTPGEDDAKKIADLVQLYKTAKNIEKDYTKKGDESELFYVGEQWSKADVQKLKAEDRASLNINEIKGKIDLISGYQRQNRFDIKCFPIEGGDAKVADILNVVVKQITETNEFPFEESEAFEDQAITGRGNIDVTVDYDENLEGEIIIEHFPWKNVHYGPHNKKNIKDLEYLVKWKWLSRAAVEALWPDKADEIGKTIDYDTGKMTVVYAGDNYAKGDQGDEVTVDPDLCNIAKKEFKVLELQRKEYRKVSILVRAEDDFVQNAADWPRDAVKKVRTIPGFSVIDRKTYRMRQTVGTLDTLLEDSYPDWADNDFTLTPVYATKRGDSIIGKVETAKDPQREINKRHSQMIDIMNKVAPYGYFYDEGTFPTPKEEKEFTAQVAKPGFKLKVTSVDRPPLRVDGIKFPMELANVITLDSQKIREVMNINLETEGQSSNATSGVAIVERKRQGLIGNEYLFDNAAWAKRHVGTKIVKWIQKLYSPERILRIVKTQAGKEPVEIGGQQVNPDDAEMETAILQLLKTADLTKIDIQVAESGYSPTMRRSNFIMWAELAMQGFQVPPQLIIDLSDLPDKTKAQQWFQQMQQAAEKERTDKIQGEIEKTKIAANAKTGGAMDQGGAMPPETTGDLGGY